MKKSQADKTADGYHLAAIIRDSAHQIWLAGLGAYARAEEEGGRLFEGLVALGETMERKAREQVTKPIRVAEQKASEVKTSASDTWDRLEEVFERRVAKALNSLQIPTHRDVLELTQRVESLQKAVDSLAGKKVTARKAAPRKKTAGGAKSRKKPAARKVAKKKAAARSTARRRAPQRKKASVRKSTG